MQGEEQESDTVGNFCTKVSTPLKHTDNMEHRTAREQHTHNGEAGTGYRHRLSHSNNIPPPRTPPGQKEHG